MHPECPDYDLCEKCEASPFPVHPENHPMLKTKIPLRVDVSSTMDVAGEIAMNNGPRGHHHRRGHREPYPSAAWRRRADARCRADARWNQPREHVMQAQPIDDWVSPSPTPTEPTFPGSYQSTRNIYDQDELSAHLAAPIIPDNRPHAQEGRMLCEMMRGNLHEGVDFQEAGILEEWLIRERDSIAGDEAVGREVSDHSEVANHEAAVENEEDVKREESLGGVTSNAVDTAVVAKPSTKEPVTPLDIFSWVRHMTITPGCVLPAGAEFTKTWRLKHFASGSEYEFETVKLVHQSEGLLGPACKPVVEYNRGDVKEGGEFEVSIHGLRVPDLPGREIVEHWRFEDAKGVAYGQPLRLR